MTRDRLSLAEDRTALAKDRTLLAHERSFASWVRTGLASLGIGLGFGALFKPLEPTWIAKAIASIFLLIAIFVFLSASRRACAVIGRIQAHQIVELKPMRIRLLAWTLVAATMALGIAMWTLIEG